MAWTACVVRIHRKGKVESFLVDADKFVIGRSPDCDFVVADEQISRQHLGILLRNGQAFLKDLGSANGSFIGDQRVPQDRVLPYKNDDVVKLGNTKITVTLEILGKKIEPKMGEDLNVDIDDSIKFAELIETVTAKSRALHQDYERIIIDARAQLETDAKAKILESQRQAEEIIAKATSDASQQGANILNQAKSHAEVEAKNMLAGAKLQIDSVHIKTRAMIEDAERKASELSLEAAAKAKVLEDEAKKVLEQAEEKKKLLLEEIETSAAKAHSEVQVILEAGRQQAEASLALARQNAADIEKKNREALQESELRIRINQEAADKALAEIAPLKKALLTEAQAEAVLLGQEAQKKSAETIQAANQRAADVVSESRNQAKSIVEAGEQSALRIVEESKKAVEKLALEAQQQSLEIINLGRVKADLVTKEANSYLDLKRKDAEASAQKILQEVNVQVDRMHSDFEAKKRDEIARLERDFELAKDKLKTDQEGILARYESDFQLKHKLFDEECSIRRRQIEKELQSETEKIADSKKLFSKLQQDIQSAQDKLSQATALGQAAETRLQGVETKITLAMNSAEDLSVKVDGLSREEQRLQAFVTEVTQKKRDYQADIQALHRKLEEEKSRIDKETYDLRLKAQVEINDLRQKENQDIQRVRIEELEKIDGLRKQAVEDIVRNKSVFKIRLSQKIEGRVVSVLKSNGLSTNLPALQKEILELVQGSIEEQSYELAQGHEADIKQLVTAETNKRKSAVRRTGWIAVASIAAVVSLFIYNGGNISNVILGLNQKGETGAEEFGRIKREERAGQKFDPPQSDFIKSSYTDNVLYTRAYTDVYNDPQLQEKWIHELNKIFSKEWGLDDDAIVKFVAIETTLIGRLKTEKESIIPGFEKIGIDKMRKVEKESLDEMKAVLKDSTRMRKFQSYAEKFWFDGLKERRPASDQ